MGEAFDPDRELDVAPGIIGVTPEELPSLPDEAMTDPERGRVDPRAWFADASRPFEIEIGSGKGTFLVGEAGANPGVNYLGIEWAGEFYAYAADRLRRHGYTNVRMLRTDATEFIRWRCPSGIVRVIHLYFSDPWPKSRHHKNRVVQHRFLAEAWRVLLPGGELRVVTDHAELWAWDEEHFSAWTDTTIAADAPAARRMVASAPAFTRHEFVPPAWVGADEIVGTNFERKYRVEGRTFRSCVLRKMTGA